MRLPSGRLLAPLLLLASLPVQAETPLLSAQGLASLRWRGVDPPAQFEPWYLGPRAGAAVDEPWRGELALDLQANLAAHWEANFRFRLDSDGRNDPRNRTRDFAQLGASNNVDQAVLRRRGERLLFELGRFPLSWGAFGEESLLLSGYGPAPDAAQLALDWGPHRLRALVAQLSSVSADSTTARWLYGHRLEFEFDRFGFALSELALVAGRDADLSLRYLNPVQFYTQAQTEDDGDAAIAVNTLVGADFHVELPAGLQLRGSLVVDDFQIDREGRERRPHQLAHALRLAHTAGHWRSQLDWRRIGSWTYLHRGDGTEFSQFGRPLGAPEGPDVQRLRALVVRELSEEWRLQAGITHWRRGINRLDTTESSEGHAGEGFPRGRASEHLRYELAARWRAHARLGLRCAALLHRLDGETFLELQTALECSTPRWLLGRLPGDQ